MKLTKKDIPNILSFSRIVLSPLSLIWVYIYPNPQLFFIYLLLVHATDIADGYLARKYGAVSHFGRKLDSYADYIIGFCIMLGTWIFLKEELSSNLLYLYIILGVHIIPIFVSLIKLGYMPQLHLNTNKVAWGFAGLFLFISIFFDFFPTIYLISTILFLIAGIDRVIFYLLLRNEEDMKILSSWELIGKLNKNLQ